MPSLSPSSDPRASKSALDTRQSPVKMYVRSAHAPGISQDEFSDHWRHPHGTVARTLPSLQAGYVQGHRVTTTYLDEGQASFDGIGELYFDNWMDIQAMATDPLNAEFLLDDMQRFVDISNQRIDYAVEEVVDSGFGDPDELDLPTRLWSHRSLPSIMKLFVFVERDGPENWAAADDLSLGRRIGALRHVRSHPALFVYHHAGVGSGGTVSELGEPDFRGIRELCWPTMEAFTSGVAADEIALAELLDRSGPCYAALVRAERLV